MSSSDAKNSGTQLTFGDARPARSVMESMMRGFRQRCPACGEGRTFRAFLKVNDRCPSCGEELHHQRADDAPPYFTILIVAHIIVPLAAWVEYEYAPNMTLQALAWSALTIVMSLWFLPRIKGSLIGLQWANYMHGFGGEDSGTILEALPDRLER